MFSRSRQPKPLKAVPLKFIDHGENLDVANNIMSVEMSGNKTPKSSRRKASTMSSQRRSASIERIFEKQKSSSEKQVKQQLQKQLHELREREQLLKSRPDPNINVPQNKLPPPPPPPLQPLQHRLLNQQWSMAWSATRQPHSHPPGKSESTPAFT